MPNVVCSECGNVFDDEMKFCPKCGRELPLPVDRGVVTSVPRTGDPVADGFSMMAAGDYEGAMASWKDALESGTVPDDVMYTEMVSAAGACMLMLSGTSEVKARAGTSDLDLLMDDRDFALDLLCNLRRRIPECTGQVSLVNLSTNYMLLVIDCFNLYTDLRDLKGLCDESNGFISDVLAREDELKGDGLMGPATAAKYIETNNDFISMLSRTVDKGIESSSDEDLDLLADRWADRSSLPYVSDLHVALRMSIQLRVTGKLASKLIMKTMDASILGFMTKYLAIIKG